MKNIILLACLFAAVSTAATPAPNFSVTTSNSQSFQLYPQYISQGKLVVIEAFFTTCPPCNAHAPLLQNLYTQMLAAHPGKVEFLLLSTLSTDTNVKVATYKTSKSLTMPAAGADGGSITALQPYTSGQFGPFQGTPTFIVIAPGSGEVHFDIRGNSASETMSLLTAKIAELLPVAPPPPAPVVCNLRDFFDAPIGSVQLQVTAPGFDTLIEANGSYTLSNVAALQNQLYTINPQKNDNPLNGITTYDLLLISKHILGIESLLCDWQRIAADVNCSGTITTLDIVTARKLLLGLTQSLPCDAWRFVPDSASAVSGGCAAFQGVKIGDVNGQPCNAGFAAPETRTALMFQLNDRWLEAGETTTITINAAEAMNIQGLQLSLQFDPKKLIIKQISSPLLEQFDTASFNLEGAETGAIPISWINPAGQAFEAGDGLLTLEVSAAQAGQLSNLLTLGTGAGLRPEIYDATGYPHSLGWQWNTEPGHAPAFQIHPNPARSGINLSATLSADQNCFVQITDMQGKIVLSTTLPGQRGFNQWYLPLGNNPPGLYGVRVNGLPAGKIVRL